MTDAARGLLVVFVLLVVLGLWLWRAHKPPRRRP
jgi:MYXO-CTERM domain-containing protein